MTPTRHMTKATLTALFAQAARAIGHFEAQRRAALLAIESQAKAPGETPKPPTP